MGKASRDSNNVPTILGALSTDGVTPIPIQVNVANHGLKISDGTTGTDHGTASAARDVNFVPVLMAVSNQTITVNGINYIQGVTPVEVYADSSGNLLVQTT